jgi:hypothetical protein
MTKKYIALLFIVILVTFATFNACINFNEPERPYSSYLIYNQSKDTIIATILFTSKLDKMKYNDSIACLPFGDLSYRFSANITERSPITIYPRRSQNCLFYYHNPGFCTNYNSGSDYNHLPISQCPTKVIDSLIITNTSGDTLLCFDNTECVKWEHKRDNVINDYWYPNELFISYTFKYPTKE